MNRYSNEKRPDFYHRALILATLTVILSLSQFGPTALAGETSKTSTSSTFVLPGWLSKLSQAQMDTLFGLLSNEGVDIVVHDQPTTDAVWIGTTQGLSYTENRGDNWFSFNSANGLNADNVSALYAFGDTIWVATVTSEVINEVRVVVGSGLQFSADGGMSWESPTDTTGILADATVGPLKVPFDIASDGERTYSANFVGGLVGTSDYGATWRRFHLTPDDSLWFASQSGAPPLSSRYFSVVADTGHTDTTIFWAGNACGIVRFDFVEKHIKPSSNRVFDHAFDSTTGAIYLAGNLGLSRADAFDYTGWKSVFAEDGSGLPGNNVNEAHIFGGKLFVACQNTLDGDGIGFVWTNPDLLGPFNAITGAGINAVSAAQPGAAVHELIDYADRYLYLAGGTAGLFVSIDTGASWSAIPTGLGGWGAVYSLAIDTLGALWCGTDSGIVTLYIDRVDQSGTLVDSLVTLTMYDHSPLDQLGSGGSVRDIEFQAFITDTITGQYDSVVVWTANFPASDTGSFSAIRLEQGIHPPVIDTILSRTSRVDQIASRGGALYFAGQDGLRSVSYSQLLQGYLLSNINSMEDASRIPFLNLPVASARSIFMHDSVTHVSADQFLALSHRPVLSRKNWRIALANTVESAPDSGAHYHSTVIFLPGGSVIVNNVIPGAFVPAMGVQYGAGPAPIIWAACRPGATSAFDSTEFCFDPIGQRMVAKFDFNQPADSQRWEEVPELTQEIWNFAFDGPEVYVASTEGLFHAASPIDSFAKIDLISSRASIDISPDASVNGVRVIAGDLWVTTEDGVAMAPLDSVFNIFKADPPDEAESYAYPTPFRPSEDFRVKFRYVMPDDATTSSIAIYDFAMNLVKQVTTDEPRGPGEVPGDSRDAWDGRNGEDAAVVPGIYYFKVEYSNGESDWGKLAVIP